MASERKIFTALGLAILAVVFEAAPARAGVIYSDFGAGNAYASGGYGIAGSNSLLCLSGGCAFVTRGFAFTPSDTEQLVQIDAALLLVQGTNSVQLTLNAGNSGLPGAVLATWVISSLPLDISPSNCCTVQTVTPTSTIILNAGSQYWIVASAIASSNTEDVWAENSTGATGLVASNNGPGYSLTSGAPMAAFDVIGAPEPGTLALGIGALALLVSFRRRARV